MKTQFIIDEQGKRTAVILPIRQYQKMLEDIEDLEDIKLYDAVKAKKEATVPLEEYLAQRKARKDV